MGAYGRVTSRAGLGHGDLVADGAVPRGNAMAPPELARDAPVVDVGYPLDVDLLVVLGREADGLVAGGVGFDGGDGPLGHRCSAGVRLFVDGDEPLRGEARLDHGFAAVAV